MGVSKNAYLGIYLVIPHGQKKIINDIRVHPETGKKMKAKFCPVTGVEGILKENITYKVTKASGYEFYDVEGFDEDLFNTLEYGFDNHEVLYFMEEAGKFTSYCGYDEELILDLSEEDINPAQLIHEFKEKYRKYLAYWEKEFGSVQVNWGLLEYWN